MTYTKGRQPCDAFDPRMDGNQYATWANVHECFGPYDERGRNPDAPCPGKVSFCEACHSDHHTGGWDTCGKDAAP